MPSTWGIPRRIGTTIRPTFPAMGANPMAQATTDAERLVTEYVDAWNERDFSKFADLLAESFTFNSPTAGTVHGRQNCEEYASAVVGGFSDFQILVQEMVGDENLVMTESLLVGTHDGEYDGIPPTHEKIEIRDMAKFVVEDGKLQEERLYFDRQEFLDQLGASRRTSN